MENVIKINKKYLVFRDQVNDILKNIEHKKKSKKIYLDFEQVNFISRSFADEWLSKIDELQLEKTIKIINLKSDPKKLLSIVKKTREKIAKELEID